jgi:adenosine deaminase
MALKLDIWHKAVIGRLRDPQALQKLLDDGCETTENHQALKQHLRMLFPDDYDQENEDAQIMYEKQYDGDISKIIEDISQKFFFFYNSKISLRREYLQDYHIFSTALDTYPFFAFSLLEKSAVFDESEHRITYIKGNLDETFNIEGDQEKRLPCITDMHIHLGAVLDFSYRLHVIVLDPEKMGYPNNFDKSFEPFLYLYPDITTKSFFHFFSLLESFLFHICSHYDVHNKYTHAVLMLADKLFKKTLDENYFLGEISNFRETYISPRLFSCGITMQTDPLSSELISMMLRFFDTTSGEFDPKYGDKTLVILFLHFMQTHETSTMLYRLFSAYFIMRNIIKSQLVQQHRRIGFGYFSDYSRSYLKNQTKNGDNIFIVNTLRHTLLKTEVEARVGIPKRSNEIRNFYSSLHQTLTKVNNLAHKPTIEMRIIHHFLKNEADDPKNQIVCFEKARKNYQKQVEVLLEFINDPDLRYKDSIDLAYNYFQGIDAASFESKVPPEVFAPIYSFFKKSVYSSGIALRKEFDVISFNPLELQYTYHVGEEFRDIISGLRRIVEAIIFLDLKNEDRIGHAVALGIEPKLFLNQRKTVTLSKGEYFDNLIFLYFILQQKQEEAPISINAIKSNIHELIFQIYENVIETSSATVDDFIDAWLLRRNCPLQLWNIIYSSDIKDDNPLWKIRKDPVGYSIKVSRGFTYEYLRHALPDFFGSTKQSRLPLHRYKTALNNPKAYWIFWHYATSKKVRDSYSTLIEQNLAFNEEVYEYFQDVVMQHFVARRDIVVEILPTSNILVTPIDHYKNHPFLRLKPPDGVISPNRFNIRKEPIKIILGTDDPGIQGTNFIIEMYLIKDVVAKYYGKATAQKYIDDLVRFSSYMFSRNKKKD